MNLRFLMFVLFVLTGSLMCFPLMQNEPDKSVRITGKVIDKETGKPIAGATVKIKDKSYAFISSETGFFTLSVNTPEVLYISYPNKDAEFIRVIKNQTTYRVELKNKVEKIYKRAPQAPEFPGGDEAYEKFLSDNLKYKRLKGPEKRVYIEAIVGKDGSMTDIKVRHGNVSILVEEALRVFRMMPKWNPGMRNGEPVRVKKMFVIRFPGTEGNDEFVDFFDDDSEYGYEPYDENGVYNLVIEMPKSPEGYTEFIASQLKWPKGLNEAQVKGKVIVQFVVEKDGSITCPTIFRGLHPLLDAEALRVVGLMPNWTPGRDNGEPVAVKCFYPIAFHAE